MSAVSLNAQFKTAVFAVPYPSSVFIFFISHEVLLARGGKNITPHTGASCRAAYQETTPPSTEPEGSLSYSKIFRSYLEA